MLLVPIIGEVYVKKTSEANSIYQNISSNIAMIIEFHDGMTCPNPQQNSLRKVSSSSLSRLHDKNLSPREMFYAMCMSCEYQTKCKLFSGKEVCIYWLQEKDGDVWIQKQRILSLLEIWFFYKVSSSYQQEIVHNDEQIS